MADPHEASPWKPDATGGAAENCDELAAFHHEEFPTWLAGKYPVLSDWKLAYSPEVAQAQFMPSEPPAEWPLVCRFSDAGNDGLSTR